jgi:hypothetical protein
MFVPPLAGAVQHERDVGRAPADGIPPEDLIRLLLGLNERALEHHVRRDEDEQRAAELSDHLTRVWLTAIYGIPR